MTTLGKVYALFWLSCEYYMECVSNTFPFPPLLVLDSLPIQTRAAGEVTVNRAIVAASDTRT